MLDTICEVIFTVIYVIMESNPAFICRLLIFVLVLVGLILSARGIGG